MAMQEALFLPGPICFLLEICLWRPSSRADSYFLTRNPQIFTRKPKISARNPARNPNISTRNLKISAQTPKISTRNPKFVPETREDSGRTLVLQLGAAEQVVGGGHHRVQVVEPALLALALLFI